MKWNIDTAHSAIEFGVRHLGISTVKGRFQRFEGTVETDERGTPVAVDVTIQAASIETGVADRDAHLRSPDFLDVERFPEMLFRSTEIVRKSGAVFDVSGRLLLHGIERHVRLEVDYGGRASDPNGIERAGLLARGTIDRREFGLGWNRSLDGGAVLVGHDVELDLAMQGVRRT